MEISGNEVRKAQSTDSGLRFFKEFYIIKVELTSEMTVELSSMDNKPRYRTENVVRDKRIGEDVQVGTKQNVGNHG